MLTSSHMKFSDRSRNNHMQGQSQLSTPLLPPHSSHLCCHEWDGWDSSAAHERNLVGDTGDVYPHFFRRAGHNLSCTPTVFSYGFIWRGFKTKCDVCHVLCEEFFIFDVTHTHVDVEIEFGVVSLILIFL